MALRRGRNEGSIFEFRGGFAATLSLGVTTTADGKQKRNRKTVTGKTKTEVLEALNKLKIEHGLGEVTQTSKEDTATFLARWLETSVRPNTRPNTLASYAKTVRLNINPYIGGIPLTKLAPMNVQGMLSQLEKAQKSPRARQLARVVLRRALKQAVRWNLIAKNPADAVDAPRVKKKEMQCYDSEQAKKFLEVVQGTSLAALYDFTLKSGMRQGEVLGLQWADVDFSKNEVTIRNNLIQIGGKIIGLHEPKTEKGKRTVSMPESSMASLRAHKAKQQALYFKRGRPMPGYVFPSAVGTPLLADNVRRHYYKVLKRAGLPKIRFHDLRHTLATILLASGESPKVVQDRLGHSSISLTMDTYAHVLPKQQRDAANRIEEALK